MDVADRYSVTQVSDRSIVVIAIATSLLLVVFLFVGLVHAGFSILDDHHILAWVGDKGHLPIADAGKVISASEIGDFGKAGRFRPVYFLQLIGEAVIFGDRPLGYHVVQVLSIFLFFAAAAWAAFRFAGLILGLAVVLAAANGLFWGDVWTYSMVPEQTAVPGLGLTIIGLIKVIDGLRDPARRLDGWFILYGIGTLVCAGAKENFIFLIAPYTILTIWVMWKERLSTPAILIASALFLAMFAVAEGVIAPNLGKPTDFYGADASLKHRIQVILTTRMSLVPAAAMLAALAGAGAVRLFGSRGKTVPSDAFYCIATLATTSLYLFWEIFFYNGRIPSGIRYDLPSALLYFVILIAIYRLLLAFYDAAGVRLSWPRALTSGAIAASAIVTGVLIGDGIFNVRKSVAYFNQRSDRMASDLDRARSIAAAHPDWPIVVIPTLPFDYETTLTAPLWFRHFHVRNPMFVVVKVESRDVKSPFEQVLVDQMVLWSRQGFPDRFSNDVKSLSAMMASHQCYEVAFRAASAGCTPLPYAPTTYLPIE